jgi:predicted AAA+ superfamily ATPase
MKSIFKRKIYQKLLEWKEDSNGKTAALIEGARRVGKSTIVRQFAQKEYRSFLFIDFNKASRQVKSLFDDLMDLDFLFIQLQATYNVVLYPHESVIIFDEVQQCPRARQAIKYLVEDGRYDYIETGSLISIRKNTADITIPSEERRIHMNPMDYEEFRWALGDEASIPLFRMVLDKRISLGAAHRQKMRELRLYMLVGGMPQAVERYIETNNLKLVDDVKRDIISLYREDFRKLDPTGRLQRLYMNIPAQLSNNNGRYQPYQILGNTSTNKMTELLVDLEDSKTVNVCWHCNDPHVGMSLTQDDSRFKIYSSDTGLFVTLSFWDKDFTENVIYQKLLSDKLDANLGYIYENLVAQMLTASGNKLFYYTWQKDEKHNYEIDFLLSRGAKLWPIEVKSSNYRRHASLDAFCEKFSSQVDRRYLIYSGDIQKNSQTLLLPIYLTPVL